MGELTLIRHGQANSGATTEEDYDRLSALGHTQAALLGDWMRAHADPFDLVLSGTMRRHRETAAGMGYAPEIFDERLNEMEYFALARDMQVHHDIAPPNSPEDFAIPDAPNPRGVGTSDNQRCGTLRGVRIPDQHCPVRSRPNPASACCV